MWAVGREGGSGVSLGGEQVAGAPLSQGGFQGQGSREVGHLLPSGGPSFILLVILQGSTSYPY